MDNAWEGQTMISSYGCFGDVPGEIGRTQVEIVPFRPRAGKPLPFGVEQHRYTLTTPEGPVDIVPGQWIAIMPSGQRWVCEDPREELAEIKAKAAKAKRPARKKAKKGKRKKRGR